MKPEHLCAKVAKMGRGSLTGFLVLIAILCVWARPTLADFHVSPKGADTNAGTKRAPFATLERARDAVRSLKQNSGLPAGGVTVWIHKGDYPLTQSFSLTNLDSGEPGRPILYRGMPGEKVRLLGGCVLPAQAFHPVTDAKVLARLAPLHEPRSSGHESAPSVQKENQSRLTSAATVQRSKEKESGLARKKVLWANLGALGITNLGTFPDQFSGAALLPELFFNDERMTLARWPNDGWAGFTNVIESGPAEWRKHASDKLGQFEFDSGRLERWRASPGVWLNGYWCFDWASETIRIGEIDADQHRITLARRHHYGLGRGNPGPRRFYAVNLLEELDKPGEYFIDRTSGTLYFWPPGSLRKGRAILSTLDDPVVSLQEVSHVTLRGLTVMDCVGRGILVNGGRENQILACRLRNTGTDGIVVEGGEKHRVVACEISDNGTAGLRMNGGDRKTLSPCGHEAVNNHIHHVSCRQRTGAGHVHIGGVGIRLANNLIHDGPHQAIWLGGNDHVIEFNEVHHTGMESDDCGAFYMGRNPSERGSILRYNFWHDTGSQRAHGSCAVYFDDGAGGQTVFGNVFCRASGGKFGAVFSHGGHDNVAVNNIFVDCSLAFGSAPWPDKLWKEWLVGEYFQPRLLKDVDITKPPYVDRYPALKGFLDYSGGPRLNHASNNVVVNCPRVSTGNWATNNNFIAESDPGFMNAKVMNFRLRNDSVIFEKLSGFQPIPLERIGLVRDELRKEVERR